MLALRSGIVDNPRVHVIDYGLGNLLSVAQGLVAVGAAPLIAGEPQSVAQARKIILPGVGAFPVAMKYLRDSGLDVAVIEAAKRGVPVLGICLGMQLLFDHSSEFENTRGLGLIEGGVVPLLSKPERGSLRSTHIGWRAVTWNPGGNRALTRSFDDKDSYYFVHSYVAEPSQEKDLWASVRYGAQEIAAVVGSGIVWGTQFHPEKSGEAGLKVLRKFVHG